MPTSQNQLKQDCAHAALEWLRPKLESDLILGIGTGSTANYFIDALGALKHQFDGAVASSEATAQRLQQQGIRVYDLNTAGGLEFYIDGADEANTALQLIKGGGGALTREKIIAAASKTFICIADQSKQVELLGNFPLPVEVIPMARSLVGRKIVELGGNPVYREGFVTDNQNIILDIYNFPIDDPIGIESQLNQITGVVTNGLFARRPADVLLLGGETGVQELQA